MDVRVVYFEGCPSWRVTVDRLHTAVAAAGRSGTVVELVRVESAAEAAAAGFAGSPTVLVDGEDLFPGAAETDELACRLYSTPDGPRGAPTLDALLGALADRMGGDVRRPV